ncbi:MAG: adenylosuccinate lyase [Phycisphaerales bacterium]|nr:MAG: adenylosuccinate lyase [Phycisphaerales bacterium]
MPMPNSSSPSPHDTYTSPLASRNASPAMLKLWSARHKFNTWRRIWLAVAEAQYEVTKDWGQEKGGAGGGGESGGPLAGGRGSSGPLVTKAQVEALRKVVERESGITDAELERAAELERELRHDVMAHVHCLGESCPEAKGIIHLGCTSQDVVCNADLFIMHEATDQIVAKVVRVISALGEQASGWLRVPTLGFTHYQPAQPVTVGRRLAYWACELTTVHTSIDNSTGWDRRWRGLRGATGTQASFLELLNGNDTDVDRLENYFFQSFIYGEDLSALDEDGISYGTSDVDIDMQELDDETELPESFSITLRAGTEIWELTGQTYPRIHDAMVLADLASVAAVLHKIATDIRLLSNRKELDEPFGDKQIGSSAMPYKRNPMKCERICGLSRFVMNLVGNAYDTAATQWLERTLDDSSNRRLSLPEAFLALDGALDLMHEVASGLVVHEAMVRKNLMAELPFLATENILMAAVRAGGDRQELHEKIRVHAQAAGMRVKQEGLENDLIERLRADAAFASVHHLLTEDALLDPMRYVGRSVEQTERFVEEVVEPLRERYEEELRELGSSDRGV